MDPFEWYAGIVEMITDEPELLKLAKSTGVRQRGRRSV